MAKLIHARLVYQALLDAGIVREEDRVRRVIIDIRHDQSVIIHTERYADEGILKFLQDLDTGSIEIVRADG